MRILDCETKETTYTSLAAILDVDKGAMDAVFEELDIDRFDKDNPDYPDPPECVVFSRVSRRPLSAVALDGVCWFHLTRIPKSEVFLTSGILPLNLVIDSIWASLYSRVENWLPKEKWAAFRERFTTDDPQAGNSQYLYHMKVTESLHWGPYAILVREIAFMPQVVETHDYLRTPEIVEDICRGFQEEYKFDLLAEYRAISERCIVKFTDDRPRRECIVTALWYLYASYHNYKPSVDWSTCFDNHGVPVPPGRILRVEWLGST